METSRGWKYETQEAQSSLGTKSSIISHHWNNILSEEARQDWGHLAEWLKTVHKEWFPNYKFAPVSKNRKAEVKRERKLQIELNKAMGLAPVVASSRPQAYTKPSASRRVHRASNSSSSSSNLCDIPTPPLAPFQDVGPSTSAPSSVPFMGPDPFGNNMNCYVSHAGSTFDPPSEKAYDFPLPMGWSGKPVPNSDPSYDYTPSSMVLPGTSRNALFNISPGAYQDVGNWANTNDMPFNGQVDSTIDRDPGFIPNCSPYDLWGNPLTVNRGMMPAPPPVANPLFSEQFPDLMDQASTRQTNQYTIGTSSWPVWE
ncbi:hypothetical protein HYPSUDRAFT_74671 [Hypholoma sublateritium FD-334 SS-4]|uniref:HMG box domain-containing protein n=1 Tax=Hypholoma sublateritium (strain FD-334 SS-4) TaxID=945553 RepID=A0A0D2P9Y5_HYPSF|nr:hypothetical protein HYPSUDRAFT_74671 [Hypholoma sublateritium FD-334 SS-4]